tara:strand:+ start:286 stop:597 length:312 start_codon:yes stop_codon:yes gene_type:complete
MTLPTIEFLQKGQDQNLICDVLGKWLDAKPDNKELGEMYNAFLRVFVYTNNLELRDYGFNRLISEARSDRNRAVLRARNVEKELEVAEAKVKDLEAKLKIFGI